MSARPSTGCSIGESMESFPMFPTLRWRLAMNGRPWPPQKNKRPWPPGIIGESNHMNAPTLNDVYVARERISPYVPRTPLLRHPLLDEATGLSIWVKHENHNPTCAFKVRGGLNLVGAMSLEERAKGIVTASTGNHGQSMAMASRIHGVPCTVFVPAGNNPERTPPCAPMAPRSKRAARIS